MMCGVRRFVGGQVGHRARRLVQSPRAFANWVPVLRDMSRSAGVAPSLTFVARTGERISCPNVPGARVPVYEIFAEDCYRLTWFLGPLLDQPIRVLDIGAHVGAFACRTATLAPRATFTCVEASATTAEYLQRNVEANGIDERVHVRVAAVAAHAGSARLVDRGKGSALNAVTVTSGGDIDAVTLDALVMEAGSPDVVKIDCEGSEYDIVLASSAGSWAGVRRVVVEYHDVAGHGWDELEERFASLGFSVLDRKPVTPRQGTAWLDRGPLPGTAS